ncbi:MULTISPECIES: hypothetical protein [Pseudoxanthomonas]|uniref:hypothetical protein n=1 Tax=Pseudoxanthomonas TaxID=83618 RepID=UPI0028C3EBE0|nr:hypothetical protein [Pseudoxanthomonas sp.]
MSLLGLLFAASMAASEPHCVAGAEATRVAAVLREEPSPLGLIVGTGSDWGAKFLVVSTTHRLGVPGIATHEGTASVRYYAFGRERACTKEIELTTCGSADIALRAFRSRAYSVMHSASQLRLGAAYHPPFALLHTKDGDGNITKITATQSEHPLMQDAAQTFSSIESCTRDVDDRVGGP